MSRSWGLTAGALTLAATLNPIANGTSRIVWGYCFPVRHCYDHGPRWFQQGVEWVYGQ